MMLLQLWSIARYQGLIVSLLSRSLPAFSGIKMDVEDEVTFCILDTCSRTDATGARLQLSTWRAETLCRP
eukprot:4954657-Heterocapsa_arctica.AAC.1